jgi:hypothetical protein
MGMSRLDLERLLRLVENGQLPKRTAVADLGAQQLGRTFFAAPEAIKRIGAFFGATSRFEGPLPGPGEEMPVIPTRKFWTWLGCSYAAIDIDGSPGVLPLDLNYDDVPADFVGKYQFVTNYGTSEHVANQLNVFKIIHDLAAPGGIMAHTLPAQGLVNHGLVNYNPKFFWMLARSNGYEWLHIDFAGHQQFPVPPNVIEHVSLFMPDVAAREKDTRLTDASVVVILKKVFDIPFVPPLDVNTGTRTDNAALAKRYWTIFDPDAFNRLIRESRG